MARNQLLGKNAIESYRRVQLDPAASHWLKGAMQSLSTRDPVDAMHDVQCLLAFVRDMCMDAGIVEATPALNLVRKILDGKDPGMLERMLGNEEYGAVMHELVHQVLHLDRRVQEVEREIEGLRGGR